MVTRAGGHGECDVLGGRFNPLLTPLPSGTAEGRETGEDRRSEELMEKSEEAETHRDSVERQESRAETGFIYF